jgi:uncharacterized protein YbcI
VNQQWLGRGGGVKTPTKGQIEAEISKALVKFEREYIGRGPADIRTRVVQDMVIIRLAGLLTPAEQALIQAEGVELLKQVRTKLLESGGDAIRRALVDITGCEVISMHSDLSTTTGERLIVLILNEDLEQRWR